MNIEVRYLSRTGNTKKIAEAIAKSVGTAASDYSNPLPEKVDLLYLGGSIYGNGIDKNLKSFIEQIDPQKVKNVAIFGSSAIKKEPDQELKKLLLSKGINVLEKSFYCRGSFTLIHRGHPNETDLELASEFALSILKEINIDL